MFILSSHVVNLSYGNAVYSSRPLLVLIATYGVRDNLYLLSHRELKFENVSNQVLGLVLIGHEKYSYGVNGVLRPALSILVSEITLHIAP